MFYDEIEKHVHQVILEKILECARQKGFPKKAVAQNFGMSPKDLSRIAAAGPHARRLTPDAARKLMFAWYFPSQITAVEDYLRTLQKGRPRRRYLSDKGLGHLVAETLIDPAKETVLIRLEPERKYQKGVAIDVLIDTKGGSTSFWVTNLSTKKSEPIAGPSIGEEHLGSILASNAFLGKIYEALEIEYARVMFGDLRTFDDSEQAITRRIRDGSMESQDCLLKLIKKAQEVFLNNL